MFWKRKLRSERPLSSTYKEMPVILVNKVVDEHKKSGKRGLRRRRGTRGHKR
jgi:hypothetical protein